MKLISYSFEVEKSNCIMPIYFRVKAKDWISANSDPNNDKLTFKNLNDLKAAIIKFTKEHDKVDFHFVIRHYGNNYKIDSNSGSLTIDRIDEE